MKEIKQKPKDFTPWFKKIIKDKGKTFNLRVPIVPLRLNKINITDNLKETNLKEIFEIVDKSGNIIGKETREECHQNKKLIHRAVNVFLFNKKGQVLLQKRSQRKDLYPGMFTGSASGHLDLGENFKQAVLRETKEELGIDLKSQDLEFIDKFLIKAPTETELIGLFFGYSDAKPRINKDEIEKIVWFKLRELFEKIDEDRIKLTPAVRQFLRDEKIRKKMKKRSKN